MLGVRYICKRIMDRWSIDVLLAKQNHLTKKKRRRAKKKEPLVGRTSGP
jgi:hypothetical protein